MSYGLPTLHSPNSHKISQEFLPHETVDGRSQPNIVNKRLVKPNIVIVPQSDFRSNAFVFINLDSISRQLVAFSPNIVI